MSSIAMPSRLRPHAFGHRGDLAPHRRSGSAGSACPARRPARRAARFPPPARPRRSPSAAAMRRRPAAGRHGGGAAPSAPAGRRPPCTTCCAGGCTSAVPSTSTSSPRSTLVLSTTMSRRTLLLDPHRHRQRVADMGPARGSAASAFRTACPAPAAGCPAPRRTASRATSTAPGSGRTRSSPARVAGQVQRIEIAADMREHEQVVRRHGAGDGGGVADGEIFVRMADARHGFAPVRGNGPGRCARTRVTPRALGAAFFVGQPLRAGFGHAGVVRPRGRFGHWRGLARQAAATARFDARPCGGSARTSRMRPSIRIVGSFISATSPAICSTSAIARVRSSAVGQQLRQGRDRLLRLIFDDQALFVDDMARGRCRPCS